MYHAPNAYNIFRFHAKFVYQIHEKRELIIFILKFLNYSRLRSSLVFIKKIFSNSFFQSLMKSLHETSREAYIQFLQLPPPLGTQAFLKTDTTK